MEIYLEPEIYFMQPLSLMPKLDFGSAFRIDRISNRLTSNYFNARISLY